MSGGISQFPVFNPALAAVISIDRSTNALIETSFAHTFVVGESVRFIIPDESGMVQMNGVVGNIITASALLPTFFTTDIDTTLFDEFIVPANPLQCAQAIPVGENALQLSGAFRNVLPYT